MAVAGVVTYGRRPTLFGVHYSITNYRHGCQTYIQIMASSKANVMVKGDGWDQGRQNFNSSRQFNLRKADKGSFPAYFLSPLKLVSTCSRLEIAQGE